MIYVGLRTVGDSIARVAERVKCGGHNVPRMKIRERWPRSLANFVKFMKRVDDVLLFSNAGLEPVLVGERVGGGSFALLLPDELPEITQLLSAVNTGTARPSRR